jgi:hypothetical protein
MTEIEQEIIQQFNQLDAAAQQRILKRLHAQTHTPKAFNFAEWETQVRNHAHAASTQPSALHILRELRAGEDDA